MPTLVQGSDGRDVAADTGWILTTAPLILLMQLGFAQLEAGSVREHNVIATYAKNSIDFVIGAWIAACFGFALAYGHQLSNPHPLMWDVDDERAAMFFQYVAFQATAATIVSGAMAERTSIIGC